MSGFNFSSTFCGEAMQYILGLFSTVVFEESIHLSNSENTPRCPSARQVSGDSDEDIMSSPLSDCSHEINESDQRDNVERILCSDIWMWKTLSGKCSLIFKCNDSSPSTQSLLSRIELTLSENSGETSSDWKTFIRAYNRCKGLSMSPAFDESVDALLLSLHSVSGLKKVQLTTDSLTENWAMKILSLCHTCPSLHDVCLQVENDKRYSLLNVCSSLIVTKNITDSTCTVDIRLARDGMIEISPSFISFTLPCSEIPKLDGQELFETLDDLKCLEESCSEHEELVGDLMSSLLSVSGLRRVGLEISCLTENWVRRILSLTEVCPSLQEIRYDCIESGGLLLEDVVRILQSSQIDSDCRIIITGVKCSKTIESSRSSSACDEKVKVTFCKDSLTRLFTIDNIETEVHNDDDPEDPDEEDFIDF